MTRAQQRALAHIAGVVEQLDAALTAPTLTMDGALDEAAAEEIAWLIGCLARLVVLRGPPEDEAA